MSRHLITPDGLPSTNYGRVGLPVGSALELRVFSSLDPFNAEDFALINAASSAVVTGVSTAASGVAQLLGLVEETKEAALAAANSAGQAASNTTIIGADGSMWTVTQIETAMSALAFMKDALGYGSSDNLYIQFGGLRNLLEVFLTYPDPDSNGRVPVDPTATVSQIIAAANAASGNALLAKQEAHEVGVDVLTMWDGLKAFYRTLGYYPLNADGRVMIDLDRAAGKVSGSGLVVSRTDEETGEQVPTLNPYLLTFTSPSGDEVFSILEVAVDVLTRIPFRRPIDTS